jgi:hypothetical protein
MSSNDDDSQSERRRFRLDQLFHRSDTEEEAGRVAGENEALRERYPSLERANLQKMNLAGRVLSEDELIDLMVKHPDLMKRPIIEKGVRAILAHPANRIREIL